MKIKKPVKKKKYIILSAVILLLIAGGLGAYAASNNMLPFGNKTQNTSDKEVDYNPPSEDQKESGDSKSEEAKKGETTENQTPGGGQSVPNEAADTPGTVAVQITAANQNGSMYQVRTIIQTVNPGTCTLTLQRAGSNPVSKTAQTQPLSSASTCKGFDIPVSSLAKGEWQLTVVFSNSGTRGTVSKSIIVK